MSLARVRPWAVPVTRRAVLTALAGGVAAACGRADRAPGAATPPGASESGGAPLGTAPAGAARPVDLHPLAERYVRLALALARHQPSLVETWRGPADWRPAVRTPVAALREEAAALRAALDAAGEAPGRALERDRLAYLAAQVRALETAARRLLGERFTFAEEAEAAFGVRVPDAGPAVAEARETVARLLPGRAPLHERLTRLLRESAVPPTRAEAAFAAAVDACRVEVRARLALPDDEAVTLAAADGLGLEAWAVPEARYRTRVTRERGAPFDPARLLRLAAHETYPGHHVQYVLADRDLVAAHDWRERLLVPAVGLHLLMAEGLAEYGADLLLEGDTFARLVRDRVVPVAGTSPGAVARLVAVRRAMTTLGAAIAPIAAAYLDGALGTEAAAGRLREEALLPDADAFLLTIERQRTRLLAYPLGRMLAHPAPTETEPWAAFARQAALLLPARRDG